MYTIDTIEVDNSTERLRDTSVSLDTILLKVASRCNIDCDYCYVYQLGDKGWRRQPKRMSSQTISAVIDALFEFREEQDKNFAIVLHGGEPLLLGTKRLGELLHGLRGKLPIECPISIQTNGILVTEDILNLCSETKTSIAVSLDGPNHVNDLHRVSKTNQSTFRKTTEGIRKLQNHPDSAFLFSGIISVIDINTDPAEIYAFFRKLGVPSLDFLYRDGNYSRLPPGKQSFDSVEYGQWLAGLWDIYSADSNPIPIRILDDIAKILLGGRGIKEGMGADQYVIVIVDTDGSITKNDTLKSSYDGADRFDAEWSIHHDRLIDILREGEFKRYLGIQRPTSDICVSCPILNVCGGGMPLYRWRDENGYQNPSVYCNDHKYIISHIQRTLSENLQCHIPYR